MVLGPGLEISMQPSTESCLLIKKNNLYSEIKQIVSSWVCSKCLPYFLYCMTVSMYNYVRMHFCNTCTRHCIKWNSLYHAALYQYSIKYSPYLDLSFYTRRNIFNKQVQKELCWIMLYTRLTLFLAHLVARFPPVCKLLHFRHLQNHGANFNQTCHKSSLREGNKVCSNQKEIMGEKTLIFFFFNLHLQNHQIKFN
jgi:hypothetical protein